MVTTVHKTKQTLTNKISGAMHNDVVSETLTIAGALAAHHGSKKMRIAILMSAIARSAVSIATVRQQTRREERGSSVTLSSDDLLYHVLQRWIALHVDGSEANRFSAVLEHRAVVYAQAAKGVLRISHRGENIMVNNGDAPAFAAVGGGGLDSADDDDVPASASERMMKSLTPKTVTLSSRSMEAIRSFLAMAVEDVTTKEKTSRLYLATRWGHWVMQRTTPPRSADSVILASGVLDDIIRDLSSFLRHEDKYVQLGLPYHRGYIFHGPPGVGKTSIARSLATHFASDIYHITLSAVEDDGQLMEMLRNISSQSILLIEDIDAAGAEVKQRTDDSDGDEKKGVTLSGLLNALDGISTPHGLITMMTSNFPQKLDSALLRSGRVDRQFYIGHAGRDQTSDIIQYFAGVDIDPMTMPELLIPSDVIELIKQTFDMEDGSDAVRTHILQHIHDLKSPALPPPTIS